MLGVVANRRPDLFKAMVLKVPFVDVLSTMLDSSLPLTTHEYDEWGDPSDPLVRKYIQNYSPCDNIPGVRSGDSAYHTGKAEYPYPHMYVTASTNDTRVGYWEPAKWVSRLKTLKQRAAKDGADLSDRMLLLRTSEEAGHFASSFEETALEYAFLYKALGLNY